MNREQAEIKLKQIFGFDNFYDEQWETIDLLFKGKRVLLIEKTGFGKSLCYQFPATQFDGLTIIFSPLIALMRDQVKWLVENKISAKFINSEQTHEENSQTIQDAVNGKLKILYIAPERQENQEWIQATRQMNLSMIVIDEAHTISVWGHDFRPAFRRIINLIQLLPKNMPVLATTATATRRVQIDVVKQISNEITTIRGRLIRDNFNLFVINVKSEDEKLIWFAENLNEIEGTGIIYTGTRVNTEIYSRWFEYLKINTTEYNAGLDGETRKEVENGLMANKWKAVVSTNALGMGIDKPDIRFLIHTQIPASPIHYYQEIGRAGRDGKPTNIILFYNSSKDDKGIEEDYKLPKAFIDDGRPSLNKYNKVINAVKEAQLGERQIMKVTNLKQTQVRVIKADLIEQGIIKEVIYGRSKKYEYQFDAPELNTKAFEELRELKLKELESMLEYVNLNTSRMKFLCEYLGDAIPDQIENCDNTNLQRLISDPQPDTINMLSDFRETYFPELRVESRSSNIVNGIAASYYGVSNVGAAISRSKYQNGGDFPDFLLKLTLKAFRKQYGQEPFDFIVYVPPTESGDLVKNFAEKISKVLKIPLSHNLVKTGETRPQKVFENGYLKRDNVAGMFTFNNPEQINGKNVIIFDDIFDSGSTIKEIGRMLTNSGASKIAPLIIARTVGGDISDLIINEQEVTQNKREKNHYKLKRIHVNISNKELINTKVVNICNNKQLLCLTTSDRKQMIFNTSNGDDIRVNKDNNEIIIPETICDPEPLWLFDYIIRRCKNNKEFLEESNKGFSYLSTTTLDKKYFITTDYIFKYLPKKNLLIVLGMADNSVGNGAVSHWANRSCLTVWNLKNGKLEYEFFPSYKYGAFDKIGISKDERYFFFTQSYEWGDLYLFDLNREQLIYSREFYSNDKKVQSAYRNAFFYHDYLIIPSSKYYEGEDFGIDCINLSTHKKMNLISKNDFSYSFEHDKLQHNNEHLFIYDKEKEKMKCFELRSIIKKNLKNIDLELFNNYRNTPFLVDDYELIYIEQKI